MCKGKKLTKYLDLGHTPPADQFLTKEQLEKPVVSYPLSVYLCLTCGLSQLGFVVDPKILFQDEYPYDSSTTRTGREHFFSMADSIATRFGYGKGDLAVDIGSNVGVLLQGFKKKGLDVYGVDPAKNIAKIANARGIPTIADFWKVKNAKKILQKKGKASVITGTNVFAHADDLDEFMQAVKLLLTPNGIFVIEAPYFLNLVKNLEYDTIYHEHLSYISIKPLIPFFKKFGMELFDVVEVGIHGGSARLFIGRIGKHKKEPIVAKLLDRERQTNLHSLKAMQEFAHRVEENRQSLRTLLTDLKKKGKTIAALSAPAKGMTLLNYCKIGVETLDFATEKNPLKLNRFTPGMDIPVVKDSLLLQRKPDYALILAWNFAPEIMENLREYKKKGGKFIIPIPKPEII